MLKEKLSIERKKAVMITADFTAPTTESYAMAWLKNLVLIIMVLFDVTIIAVLWEK